MSRIGLICGLTVCLPAFAADRPVPLVILADDPDYKTAKTPESIFEGVLERTPSKGTLGGPARFNPYRLASSAGVDKPLVRELFVSSKAPLLAVQVGQRVRVVGKLIEVEVDGTKRLELWPARIESLSEAIAEEPGADGIYARTVWQPATALKRGFRTFVFRNGPELAREMKLTGPTAADTATELMARRLRVPTVDWSKHMIVTLSAGLHGPEADRLRVTRVAVEDEKMTIYYKLEVGGLGPAAGFGYPAETVLLDQFTGTVRVQEEPRIAGD